MKIFIKIIIFCLLLFGMISLLSRILTPSVNSAERRVEYKGSLYGASGVFDMPKDSIDVLFIGSSHIYSAVSPMELWNEYGITGYDCTSSSQFPWTSYYYLEEICKKQSPKVVIVDMLGMFSGSAPDELSNRAALDYMPLSINKVKLSYVIWKHTNKEEDFYSYLFPVLRYHSRWNELNQADMDINKPYDYTRGYDIRYGNEKHVEFSDANFPFLNQEPTENVGDYCIETAEYYKRMSELCKSKGIKLLFVKTPISDYTLEMGNAMRKVAKECDSNFVDFNSREMWEEMDYDYSTDMLDAAHLNYIGACKFTHTIGEMLCNEYGLGSHKGQEKYKFWEDDYKVYCEQVEINNIIRTENIEELYSSVMDDRYKIIYTGNSSGNGYLIDKLSIRTDKGDKWSVLWNGKKVKRKYTDEVSGKLGDFPYIIDSSGIYIDGKNYAIGGEGIKYVIYDGLIGKIIDYGCIDVNGAISR